MDSKGEFARRGDDIYEKETRPQLKASNEDKFAAIDIESGRFAIDADKLKAKKMTWVACVLMLLSVAVIFGVAIPIVQWRDAETGQPLPRMVAIFTPLIIGAFFNAIGIGLLRLVGVRIWSGPEQDDSDAPSR